MTARDEKDELADRDETPSESASSSAGRQADGYHDFAIDLPFSTHPFSALKSHNIQFGIALGVVLAFVAQSATELAFDIGVASASTTGLALAGAVMLTIVLWAVGIDNAGVFEAAEADKSAVGAVQIRRKPHYLTTPMVVSFVVTYAALAL